MGTCLADETESSSIFNPDELFVTGSVGYLDEFDRPYYSIRLGSEVGQAGNLYFQVLTSYGHDSAKFEYDGNSYNYELKDHFITYSIGYSHYFPVSEKGAFTLSASLGGAYNSHDFYENGDKFQNVDGNSFFADLNIGFEHYITEQWIAHVAGKVMHIGDYKGGSNFTDIDGTQYSGIEIIYEDVYLGVEAGITFRF